MAGLLLFCTSVQADDIDRYIAQEQRLYDLPAVVVGVTRDGQLIDERVSGYVDLELGVNDGQTAGFSAAYIRVPDRRLAVVVCSNLYAAT